MNDSVCFIFRVVSNGQLGIADGFYRSLEFSFPISVIVWEVVKVRGDHFQCCVTEPKLPIPGLSCSFCTPQSGFHFKMRNGNVPMEKADVDLEILARMFPVQMNFTLTFVGSLEVCRSTIVTVPVGVGCWVIENDWGYEGVDFPSRVVKGSQKNQPGIPTEEVNH